MKIETDDQFIKVKKRWYVNHLFGKWENLVGSSYLEIKKACELTFEKQGGNMR